jgi:hypothetical protein
MIVARLRPVDDNGAIDVSSHVYLTVAPFPGDIVLTAADQKVRVIRRTIIDHGPHGSNYVDLELDARLVGEHDG